MEASVKPQWIEALKYDHALLQKEMQIPDLDFSTWIDTSYLKKAYAKSDLDYEAMVASVVTSEPRNPALKPAEIWFKDKGVIAYDSVAAMLAAAEEAKAAGQTINSTYVYDNLTGLKLFGKAAYLVKDKAGEVVAFMKKADSQQHIAEHGGSALPLSEALAMLP